MQVVGIEVGHGRQTVIDARDAQQAGLHDWRAYRFGAGLWYATTKIGGKTVYLHRFLVNAASGEEVDHWDGDGLNNRRSNLRVASHQANLANQRLSKANTSGFKGVYPDLRRQGHCPVRWVAKTKFRRHIVYIGRFDTAEQAAEAYDRKVMELFGSYARTNATLGLLGSRSE